MKELGRVDELGLERFGSLCSGECADGSAVRLDSDFAVVLHLELED